MMSSDSLGDGVYAVKPHELFQTLPSSSCASTRTSQPSILDAAVGLSRWRPLRAVRRMTLLSNSAHTQQ
jgi:hypothetical protein